MAKEIKELTAQDKLVESMQKIAEGLDCKVEIEFSEEYDLLFSVCTFTYSDGTLLYKNKGLTGLPYFGGGFKKYMQKKIEAIANGTFRQGRQSMPSELAIQLKLWKDSQKVARETKKAKAE